MDKKDNERRGNAEDKDKLKGTIGESKPWEGPSEEETEEDSFEREFDDSFEEYSTFDDEIDPPTLPYCFFWGGVSLFCVFLIM